MKRILFLLLFACLFVSAQAQNFAAKGDSCFKANNYSCAAENYSLFLEKIEGRSNMIAYKLAKAWALAGDQERTITAIKLYISNNYQNNVSFFSEQLINEKSFNLVKNDERYKLAIAAVIAKENAIKQARKKSLDSMLAFQHSLERSNLLHKINLDKGKAIDVYRAIKAYHTYPAIGHETVSFQFKITDSLHTAFLVVLPPNYTAGKRYPVLFFLHGAVSSNTGYPDYADARDTTGWNRFYTKYAKLYNVIMVYPRGNREYNWMYPDNGFYMVPAMLKQIKQVINVDDNRVFIAGHSNGATGAFSYALKQPSEFGGFYGFNTRPRIATGGTYIKNLLNRSFFNVSVDQDYYFPPGGHDSLAYIMNKLHADYQDHRYNGFPHWFPQFNESEAAHKLLFEDLAKRKRRPFQPAITWECDDIKYGRCDWLAITGLDTATQNRAPWQTQINFRINKWLLLDKKNKAVERDTALNAFNFSKRSGAVKAVYYKNVFRIEASRVSAIRIYLSPGMVNMNQPIKIIVNNKTYVNKKFTYNKSFIVSEFKSTLDRAAVWVNYVDIPLNKI